MDLLNILLKLFGLFSILDVSVVAVAQANK